MEIAKGHQAVMPYLMLNGAAGFIEFTKEVFDASLANKKMREDEKTIMHAELIINGSTIMFGDVTDKWPPANANLFVYVPDADKSYAKAKAAGATTLMELSDQSYGRTCGITDPYGNVWWITSVKN